MRDRALDFFRRATRSRVTYLLVVINLCFVASEMNRLRSSGHGTAECYAPKAMEIFTVCYFRPTPPAWEIAGVILNSPSLFASMFITGAVERVFPQLCSLMTLFNLLTLLMGVTVQWMLVGRGVERVLSRYRKPL